MAELQGPGQLQFALQQQQRPQQMDASALLMAMLQPQQMPEQTGFADIARAQAIQRELDNLDRRDMRSSGILGYFGRKSRDKKRQELMPEYEREMANAGQARSRYEQDMAYYKRGEKMRDIAMTELIKNQVNPSDWQNFLSNPEMYAKFKEAGRGPGVTVNTGNPIPSGYEPDPNGGIRPIKGSKEWFDREQARKEEEAAAAEAERKDASRTAGIQRAGGTVIQDLGRALEMIPQMMGGDGVAGANVRKLSAQIAGTPEFYINEFMDSAKSNIGLDKLQQMRESSPTGGALGQVPIAQQLRLEKVLGQADVTMTPQMMTDNLHRIQNIYFDIMYGSPEERAVAVKQGKMTQEESDRIQSQYYDLSFDEFGKSKNATDPYEQWKAENGL